MHWNQTNLKWNKIRVCHSPCASSPNQWFQCACNWALECVCILLLLLFHLILSLLFCCVVVVGIFFFVRGSLLLQCSPYSFFYSHSPSFYVASISRCFNVYYLTSEVHMDPITRSARCVCSFALIRPFFYNERRRKKQTEYNTTTTTKKQIIQSTSKEQCKCERHWRVNNQCATICFT